MDILILGNGFDLAHGLKTKYSDFLEYCQKRYSSSKTGSVDNNRNFLLENIWVKHFINKKIAGDKWIDLEKEIYEVIKKLSRFSYFRSKNAYDMFEKNLFVLSKSQSHFNFDEVNKFFTPKYKYIPPNCYTVEIKDFINFLYNQLRDFVKEFEKYLKEEISSKIENAPKYNLQVNSKCVSLLNFNYTDTCEQLYKINFSHNDCGIKTKAVYVHGKINSRNNCNLVLGTQSFDNEQIPVEFNIFKKHQQRHRYGTIEQYQELLNELKYHTKMYTPIFHIIGHSLDETDHNILRHILLSSEKSVINIYYHDEEALVRMQNNIDKIIGEEEVMSKVRFIYQHDIERGILIPQNEQQLVEAHS